LNIQLSLAALRLRSGLAKESSKEKLLLACAAKVRALYEPTFFGGQRK
jgi:hypothetical protein